jgi:hypothetical protein
MLLRQRSFFLALMLTLLFPLCSLCQAQEQVKNKQKNPAGAKPKFSQAGQACRDYIYQLSAMKKEEIIARNSDGLLRSNLDDCIIDHNDELAKGHLVTAAIIIGWLSDDSDTTWLKEYSDLKAKYDALEEKTAAAAAAATAAAAVNFLTISPIPVGFTRDLSLRGGTLRCSMDGPMRLECKTFNSYLGYVFDSFLVAMIAEDKSGARYLIGCPPSGNCASLVPDKYPFEWAGTDAVTIGGLVKEGEKDSQPHTGIYSVLMRNP